MQSTGLFTVDINNYKLMENVSSKTLILASVGAIALGVAVYYLSRDDSASKLEPKKRHTLEKLKQICDQTKLEYTCIYARNYNTMLRLKENNDWSAEVQDAMQGQILEEIKQKTEEVVRYNQEKELCMEDLTVPVLEAWIAHYSDDPYILD